MVLGLAYATGITQAYDALRGPRRKVVTYHNVLPRAVLSDGYTFRVDMDKATFAAQVAYFAARGDLVPAAAVHDDRPGLLLTFDDGMSNAGEVVAPALARHGATGVFAVCPGLIEGEIPHLWRDHLYLLLRGAEGRSLRLPMDAYAEPVPVSPARVNALGDRFRRWVVENRVEDVYAVVREICDRNDLPYRREEVLPERFHPAGWEMLRRMRDAGHEIVSHTWSHRILCLLSPRQKREELGRAREVLEARLGQPVRCVAYPFGGPAEVDVDTLHAARECGYTRGFMNVARTPGGALAEMALPRHGVPPTVSRAHLHADLSGFKSALLRR